MLNHQRLKCYELSMFLAKKIPTLISQWPEGNYYLADQLKRAMASIPLNIAEANGRAGLKDRARFFSIARGSATEVSSIIDIAHVYGLVESSIHAEFQDKLLQIVKMLYKIR